MKPDIRDIEQEDWKAFSDLLIRLSRETPYTLLTESENRALSNTQEERTRQLISDPNQLVVVASHHGSLVGFVAVSRGLFTRNRHAGSLMIGVLPDYQGKGIAAALMQRALSWAESRQITRIELGVMENNDRAIRFYERFGFEKEGIKRNSLMMDGVPVNEISMSRISQQNG
jgi:ribosomal protein S18 acetylase RimI-like enzyme